MRGLGAGSRMICNAPDSIGAARESQSAVRKERRQESHENFVKFARLVATSGILTANPYPLK
jgi:hypothetical protein